jgi:hypothetical protein
MIPCLPKLSLQPFDLQALPLQLLQKPVTLSAKDDSPSFLEKVSSSL